MKKAVEILINIIFWVIIVTLLCWYFYSTFLTLFDGLNDHYYHFQPKDIIKYVVFILLVLPGLVFNYYIFYIFLIPLIQKKRFIKAVILVFTGSVIAATIIILSFALTKSNEGINIGTIESYVFLSILSFIMGIIGSAIKGCILWISSIAERKVLEKKHSDSKTSLLLLKAQLNPHFLFNSLNNIDILIEENPKTASDYLKKLTEILRYVLYETKEDKTDLAKEIFQIKNYIELQKNRTENPRYVNFSVKGEITEQKIAPMVFLPFIENAFKHSKNKTIENAIDIEFDIENDSVKMTCKNYYETGQLEIVKSERLGIETIEQRLNLIYPKNHKLIIVKTENLYNVTLSINLSNGN